MAQLYDEPKIWFMLMNLAQAALQGSKHLLILTDLLIPGQLEVFVAVVLILYLLLLLVCLPVIRNLVVSVTRCDFMCGKIFSFSF